MKTFRYKTKRDKYALGRETFPPTSVPTNNYGNNSFRLRHTVYENSQGNVGHVEDATSTHARLLENNQ